MKNQYLARLYKLAGSYLSFVFMLSGCSLELQIDNLNTASLSSTLPSVQNSQLKLIPEVTAVPLNGEVKVQYCLRDAQGNLIEKSDYAISFQLKDGRAGTFSDVLYNSVDKCYETTFKGETVSSASDIVVKIDSLNVTPPATKQIAVSTPQLAFTGNSVLSDATIDSRIVTLAMGSFTLTGTCEPLLGAVKIKGARFEPQQEYSVPCLDDKTFSLKINADGATAPYFYPFNNDPLIQARQGQLDPIMTRIMYVASYPVVKITNATELQAMTVGNYAAYNAYILMNDIDLTAVSYTPIGSSSMNFWWGAFFGEGHKISNLTINNPGQNYQGLFGYARAGTVSDLHLENVQVVGGNWVGGFAGMGNGLMINRGSVTGTVSGIGNLGLFLGQGWDAVINQSWGSGTVSGTGMTVAGLMGNAWGGDVIDSWSSVRVTSTSSVAAGLVATMYEGGTDAIIKNSFSMGSVSAVEGAGGLVGSVTESSANPKTAILANSFSLMDVTASSATPSHYLSGLTVGNGGSLAVSPYVADPDIQISGLYHRTGDLCVNCGTANNHSTGASLENILNWSKTVWDYTWTWKIHSSGARPDLINNPK